MTGERRIRARVWLLIAAATGALSLYVDARLDARLAEDAERRKPRVAREEPAPTVYGGGPIAAPVQPLDDGFATVMRLAEGMFVTPVEDAVEPPAPAASTVEVAVAPPAEATVVTEPSPQPEPPAPIADESEPAPEIAAIEPEAPLDPNAPYVIPFLPPLVLPEPPPATLPPSFGAGGGLTPSITNAGGTFVGSAGAVCLAPMCVR